MKLFDAYTPRLSVEPIAPRHAPGIQRHANDARIADMTPLPHPYPEDGARRFIAGARNAWTAGRAYNFAVCFDDEAVGTCGLKGVRTTEEGYREAELGYWIGVPFWGRGFASAAVRLVTTFAFETLGLDRVTAVVLTRNEASARVLEKAGFEVTGSGAATTGCGEEGEPLERYALDAADWQAARSA
ncbi:MAG: GNAT family N-acetyltransferase [Bacteroidota bacterium]